MRTCSNTVALSQNNPNVFTRICTYMVHLTPLHLSGCVPSVVAAPRDPPPQRRMPPLREAFGEACYFLRLCLLALSRLRYLCLLIFLRRFLISEPMD